MREWLSGGAPPCQGGGRGFDPRLALILFDVEALIFKVFRYFIAFEKVGTFEDILGTVNFLLWNASRDTTLSAIFSVIMTVLSAFCAVTLLSVSCSDVVSFFRDNASVNIL